MLFDTPSVNACYVLQASSKALDDLRAQNEALQRQLADAQRYAQQLEASRDRADAYLGRLASSMDGMLAATAKGNAQVGYITDDCCANIALGWA